MVTYEQRSAHRRSQCTFATFTVISDRKSQLSSKISQPNREKAVEKAKLAFESSKKRQKQKEPVASQDPIAAIPKKSIYICDHCGEVFNSSTTLSTHVNIIHKGRVFHCNKCGKKFLRRGSVHHHHTRHPDGTTFAVSYNGVVFSNNVKLRDNKPNRPTVAC